MTINEARQIIGNRQDQDTLRRMVKALSSSVSKFLNTPEDKKRLEAAKVILRQAR